MVLKLSLVVRAAAQCKGNLKACYYLGFYLSNMGFSKVMILNLIFIFSIL